MNIRDFREKYWRYSLIVLILGLGALLVAELYLFLGGVLGAVTIYILLRGQMRRLTARGWRAVWRPPCCSWRRWCSS